jgi:ABC-type antimicrobial peptide transport system permease subunit
VSLRRKLHYLVSPSARRREDQDIEEELEALRLIAGANELGNLTLAAEDARAALGWVWFERLVQDARYALRSMTHHRAFTALILVSLALGIGANTAIYSLLDAVLLRRLPVRDPDALVIMKWRAKGYALASSGMMWSTDGSTFDSAAGTTSTIFPYPALRVFEDANNVLDAAFCYFSANRLALTANGETESVKGQYVSGAYFSGMGVAPVAGRLIQETDDAAESASVAVLSERMSRRKFGTASAALGQVVRIDDTPFTVIGVAPAAFFGAEPGAIPDIYVPLRTATVLMAARKGEMYIDDHLYWIEIMGRLRPNITDEQAQAVLAPRFRQYIAGTATTDAQKNDLPALTIVPGGTGLDTLRRKYAQAIYILMSMSQSFC